MVGAQGLRPKDKTMTYVSYKILAAQRLAIDPNELLMYYENNGTVYVTTPDGVQHTYTYAELNRPERKGPPETAKKPVPRTPDRAIPVANSKNLGVHAAAQLAPGAPKPTKKVAKLKPLTLETPSPEVLKSVAGNKSGNKPKPKS